MLNSIGLQNPGVDAVVEKYAPQWQAWRTPVVVNVAGESVGDYVEVVRRLEGVPGVSAIELNISCPNVGKGGLQFAIDADAAASVTAAVRRVTDLPLLVKLSPNVADIRPIARAIEDAGADALTAINTLSGMAVAPSRTKPLLGNVYGGLSGPAIKPVAVRIVYEAAQVVDIPIVAIGGVTEIADVLDFLAVGAAAVQVGTAIFADPTLPVRLVDELAAEWGPDGPEDGEAKRLARSLHGTVPVVSGPGLAGAVAYRWKCQLNENAKLPAFCSVLPEADHNEICGWEAATACGTFAAVFLEDVEHRPEIRRRVDAFVADFAG
jgi:dihydroorotate dehydrogenase (NAD+) catalytic subunit